MTPNAPVPTLDELTARFLAEAAISEADEASEVEPYEVIGGFQPSAGELWRESRQALHGFTKDPAAAPPEWAAFVTHDSQSLNHVPSTLTPFAVGLFPQRLRNFAALSQNTFLRSPACVGKTPGFTGLRGWAGKALRGTDVTTLLAASGVLAALGDHTEAQTALNAAETFANPDQRAAVLNQRGSLAWLAGDTEAARDAWALAGANAPAQFNLGLYHLTQGANAAAVEAFAAAEASLPESSGWCHLTRLFATLAS
jgi:tetratricopeptide (TPR) repeat protein